MRHLCFSVVMWFQVLNWAKAFPKLHTSSNAERTILQLNTLFINGNMVTTRNLGVSITCQTLPPRIPRINVEKHRRPYLPRRALM